MARYYRVALMICLCTLLAAGCKRESPVSVQPKAKPHRQQLLIGLLPEQDIFKQVARYEPLARYLSNQIGAKISLTVVPSYEQILGSFTSQNMDAVFFGGFTYILAHTRLGVEVLARPIGLNGTSTFRGVIFVRKDSKIRSVPDMQGKRFAFVDRGSASGYLLPLAYFKKGNVNYKTYLKESYFAGTHEDAIYDVLDRKADIGAAKSTELERLSAKDARIKNDLLVLSESSEMPETSLAVRRDLDGSLKEALKAALLSMHTDPEGARILKEFGARQFIETRDSDFEPVYEYARNIGLDLRTWEITRTK
jgi:phosphonate transport system substrate-binding protein